MPHVGALRSAFHTLAWSPWELQRSGPLLCTRARDPDSNWLKAGFAASNADVRAVLPNLLVCI